MHPYVNSQDPVFNNDSVGMLGWSCLCQKEGWNSKLISILKGETESMETKQSSWEFTQGKELKSWFQNE